MRRTAPPPPPPLTPELVRGREALEALDGVDVLDDWRWVTSEGSWWTLTCRLTISPAGATVPRRTDWKVLAEPNYPRGLIHLQPAIDDALVDTFQHQILNRPPRRGDPWRTGRICVDTGVRALGRVGRAVLDREPFDAAARLAWYLERARAWLAAAAKGELVQPGDPFELPDFGVGKSSVLGFAENAASLRSWQGEKADFGYVRLRHLGSDSRAMVVERFTDLTGREVYGTRWGRHLLTTGDPEAIGIWIRIPDVPRLPPWRAPLTWGELRTIAKAQGVPLDDILVRMLGGIADGLPHVLLLGFPIPAVVGSAPETMFWQAALLKALPTAEGRARHRRNPRHTISYERIRQFHDDEAIAWLPSENWHEDTVAARGRLPSVLQESEVFLIGAGALGSAVAELLVRGGVGRLTVCDEEILTAGNLVRHTLTLDDLGQLKATALARRLNAARPTADVRALTKRFPPSGDLPAGLLRTADVILDCTGEDDVAAAMSTYPWNGPKLFASISLGMRAQAAFSYVTWSETFPFDAFSAALRPVLDEQAALFAGAEWPREGVGCWHPVFPARIDEVWLLACAAVTHLAECAMKDECPPELAVFEREDVGGQFTSLRRRTRIGDARS